MVYSNQPYRLMRFQMYHSTTSCLPNTCIILHMTSKLKTFVTFFWGIKLQGFLKFGFMVYTSQPYRVMRFQFHHSTTSCLPSFIWAGVSSVSINLAHSYICLFFCLYHRWICIAKHKLYCETLIVLTRPLRPLFYIPYVWHIITNNFEVISWCISVFLQFQQIKKMNYMMGNQICNLL